MTRLYTLSVPDGYGSDGQPRWELGLVSEWCPSGPIVSTQIQPVETPFGSAVVLLHTRAGRTRASVVDPWRYHAAARLARAVGMPVLRRTRGPNDDGRVSEFHLGEYILDHVESSCPCCSHLDPR